MLQDKSLVKFLVETGYGSRRQAIDLIRKGNVYVNGSLAQAFSQLINSRDVVTVNDKPISRISEKKTYLMLNKPKGFLSTTSDDRGRATVMDLLPRKYQKSNLHIAGRLDEKTTGLLLLTNDGKLTFHLTHPKFEVEKEYIVTLERELSSGAFQQLIKGLELDDGLVSTVKLNTINNAPCTYAITIHEGRKRIVRRMFTHLGYRVKTLKRTRIGKLFLGNLREGRVRRLVDTEINNI
jgi:23S rRNA pseudouridine2605 synthase